MTYTWRHTCKFIYAGGLRPAPIDIEGIERCPYCGEVDPHRQAEVDALAAELLMKAHQSVNIEQGKVHPLDLM